VALVAGTGDLLDQARRRIRLVDPEAAEALRTAGAVFVDIRPIAQRDVHGTIPGALVIDRNVLEWRLEPGGADRDGRVEPGRPLIVFCQQGYASSLAAAALGDIGVADVFDLSGGFDAWCAAGLPVDGPARRGVDVEPLTPTIGAVVSSVRLAELDPGTTAAIRAALLRHRVLFFRDQHLTPSQLVAFGRRFGALTPAHPLVGGLDDHHPEVLVLDSGDYRLGVGDRARATSYNNRWHTDMTFTAEPPLGSILAAVTVPDCGGDTLWADLIDAYRTLPESTRAALDPLTAVHDARHAFGRFRTDDPTGEQGARLDDLEPVRHPVVRVHPETGERGLFVNPTFTRSVDGLPAEEGERLLGGVYAHMTAPERTVRWRWRPGDVAFWDNRATAHYAVADYGAATRVMHRVTVAGDRPAGPGPEC
jgi:taurine dioxygenase